MAFQGTTGLAVALTLCGGVAAAATATATLTVTAIVGDTCGVVATGVNFATLSTTDVTNEVTPGTLTLVCTNPKAGVTVTLAAGVNETSGQRRMTDGLGNFVPYTLFSDAARTVSVGVDGQAWTGSVAAILPTVISIYGQVPIGAYNLGTYADQVLVTVNY